MSNVSHMGAETSKYAWVPQVIGPATSLITNIIGGKPKPPAPPPNPFANLPWGPIGVGAGALVLLIIVLNKTKRAPAPRYDYAPPPRRRKKRLPRRRNPHETRSSLNHRLDQIQRDFDRYEDMAPVYRKKLKAEKVKIIKRLEVM